ncbi:glycosyl transferase, partial [Methylobacterium sp. WL30]
IDPALPFSPFAALHHDASYDALAGRVELGWDAFLTCNVSVDARLGLVGPEPFGRARRHALADLVMPEVALPGWRAAARSLTRLSPAAGRTVWRRLFQRRKRLAIARAFAEAA